jgi:XTP/dITP diphosphohydrolase
MAVARPDGTIVVETEGVCYGEILTSRQGDGGFGYDPIFYVPEHGLTFAQMTPELKQKISHRGLALTDLLAHLSSMDLE